MKTKGLRTLLAGFAALALVGTGYAAWTFNSEVNATMNNTSAVTAAIEAKNVTAEHDELYLIVDACPATNHKHLAGNGIYWSTSKENDPSKKITTVKLTGKVNYAANDIVDFSKYVGHFEVSSTLANTTYVSFGTSAASEDVTVNSVDGDCEYTYTLPTVSYIRCPENVAEVAEMKADLAATTFSVSFNVKNVIA